MGVAGRRVVAMTDIDRRRPRRRTRLAPLLLMAWAAGLSAAGNYFAQPVLGVLRDELDLGAAQAGTIVAAAQFGYAIGLALLVPLGDRLDRRGLGAALLAATAVFLVAAGAAPSGAWLLVATLLAAVTSVGAQVLVPFAAALSPEASRGRAVAIVMSGVLLGGLVGRAASGLAAEAVGWRAIYWTSAALLVMTAVVVARTLPRTATAVGPGTAALYRSTARLLVDLPALRRPILLATLAMVSYAANLTAVTLLLSGQAFGWRAGAIGLFGLIGGVGGLSMPFIGRLVDLGHRRAVTLTGLALSTGASLLMIPAAGGRLGWLVAGTVLLNLGQQAVLAAGQATVYGLWPQARGRITAVFMTLFFAGGTLGSLLASLLWERGSWTAVCLFGTACTAIALAVAVRATPSTVEPTPVGASR